MLYFLWNNVLCNYIYYVIYAVPFKNSSPTLIMKVIIILIKLLNGKPLKDMNRLRIDFPPQKYTVDALETHSHIEIVIRNAFKRH